MTHGVSFIDDYRRLALQAVHSKDTGHRTPATGTAELIARR
ncbi:hypothetical protein [Micromonospora sp. NPDC005205]